MYIHEIASKKHIADIESLMDLSIRKILGDKLNVGELEAARESMGMDTQLIADKTYFLIKKDKIIVGSGGYSFRKTLFGGNHTPNRSNDLLVPGEDSAKIRAMYTHPDWTRRGVGSYVLELSEKSAQKLGFRSAELMATISGILLYEKRGYEVLEQIEYESKLGNKVPMFKMKKKLYE